MILNRGSDVGIDIIVKLDSYTLTLHDLFISKNFFVYYKQVRLAYRGARVARQSGFGLCVCVCVCVWGGGTQYSPTVSLGSKEYTFEHSLSFVCPLWLLSDY